MIEAQQAALSHDSRAKFRTRPAERGVWYRHSPFTPNGQILSYEDVWQPMDAMSLGFLNTDTAARQSEKECPSENNVVSDTPSAHPQPQPEPASPEPKWFYSVKFPECVDSPTTTDL